MVQVRKSLVLGWAVVLALGAPSLLAQQELCGNSGGAGDVQIPGLNEVVNTYYPPAADGILAAGSTTLDLGAATGAGNALFHGDLLLIIQIQGADINIEDNNGYGDGTKEFISPGVPDPSSPGSGFLTANDVGRYEYVVVTDGVTAFGTPVGGVTGVPIMGRGTGDGLINEYRNEPFMAGVQGARRFQVVVVPQYNDLDVPVNTSITAAPWDGSTGGIVALDVAGTLTLNGTISAAGMGFRPGFGMRLLGDATLSEFNYRAGSDPDPNSTDGAHGFKGEGIAGTPRFLYVLGASGGGPPDLVDTLVEGYPDGSRARGAPGTAGGGGNSGKVNNNTESSGGGGGGNGGAGADGGNTQDGNEDLGGFGGAAFEDSMGPLWGVDRVVFGSGGGAGNKDSNAGDSHGSAGGGIIMIRTNAVVGTGTITADGADVASGANNNGGGGGGAGGSIILVTLTGDWTTVTANARGGQGGDAGTGTKDAGPGGGGGGGVILSNVAATVSTAPGDSGLTFTGLPYGSDPTGVTGSPVPGDPANPFIDPDTIPGADSGAECLVDDAPTAVDDPNYNVGIAQVLNINAASGVLANDSDPENEVLTAILVMNVAEGILTLNPDGSFTFDSTGVTSSPVTFTYLARDEANPTALDSNVATVTISVGNGPPVAVDDAYNVDEDQVGGLVVPALTGVLDNDSDPNGDNMTAALVADVTNGTLVLSADGSFTYTPNANFNGTDTFTYQASDGSLTSNTATVTITVAPINDAPVAADDSYTIGQNGTLVVSGAQGVLANDTDLEGDALTAVLDAGPAVGTLSAFNPDGSFTYSPPGGFVGIVTFTYHAEDADPSSIVTVTITVFSLGAPAGYCGSSVSPFEGGPGVLGIALAVGTVLLLVSRRRRIRHLRVSR